jgi:hypothetical protein
MKNYSEKSQDVLLTIALGVVIGSTLAVVSVIALLSSAWGV